MFTAQPTLVMFRTKFLADKSESEQSELNPPNEIRDLSVRRIAQATPVCK